MSQINLAEGSMNTAEEAAARLGIPVEDWVGVAIATLGAMQAGVAGQGPLPGVQRGEAPPAVGDFRGKNLALHKDIIASSEQVAAALGITMSDLTNRALLRVIRDTGLAPAPVLDPDLFGDRVLSQVIKPTLDRLQDKP